MNKYLSTSLGLISITVLSGAPLISSSVSATDDNDTIVDQVQVNVPVSCSLYGSGMSSHNATIPNGTYQSEIGTTTLKAFCNDPAGFAIYAVGFTGFEVGGTNSTKLVGTTVSNWATISTGTATGIVSGNDVSNWAMKLNTVSSPAPDYPITLDNGFSSYSAVPASYTKVAHSNSSTDVGYDAIGAELTTTYAAYISKTQAADTYTGYVKYTLVHPASEVPAQPLACTAGKICYYPNTTTTTGQMGQQSAADGNSVTLYASNFKRDGYGFAGWSDAYDYNTNYDAHFYGPNQTITVPEGTTANGLSLYAVWIPSVGSMQTDAITVCNNLYQDPNDGTADLSSVSALTDARDGNTYAVASLADGNCWMIENLRLDDSSELSSDNTNSPSLPLTNIYDTSSTSNHLSPTSSVAYDATTAPEGWCETNSAACINQSRLRTDNTTLYTNNASGVQNGNIYSYGNYYNWYSTTAGHGTYNKTSGDVDGDICPADWHLPTGTSSGDFYALNTTLNNNATDSTASNKLRSYPNNFIYSGVVYGASISYRNSGGGYWSSSASNGNDAHGLSFSSDIVYPGTDVGYKYSGRMVRCIHPIKLFH